MDDRPGDLRFAPTRPGQRQVPQRASWKWRGVILLAILLVAAGLGWVVFHGKHQAPPPGRFALNAPTPVVAATAEKGSMPVTLAALGTVTPLATVTVRTQISGQLVQIGFKEGQEVEKGAFLAQIDPRPYQAALDNAQGQLMRDQAQLANAKKDLARYTRLVAENSIARQQRDNQEALVQQLGGTVASDQAQVETAKLNLAYCRIVAPITGRLGLRQVDVGNYVQVSDTNGIVVITQMKPISVIFSLPAENLPAILKRMNSGATLDVTAYDSTGRTELATGTLTTIDNQIDPTTGTFKLRAQFANANEALFPNQFVNVKLLVDTLKDATLISSAAIQRGAPGTFVYLIKPDDAVTVRKVTVGPGNSATVAVTDGLAPGDRVVVEGADRLREGAKVSLPGAKSGGAAAAGARKSAAGQERPGAKP